MAENTVPVRSEIPEEYTWDLRDVYPSDEAWTEEYKSLESSAAQLQAFRGRLGESAKTLLTFLRLSDNLELRLGRLTLYASCKADEDTANATYQDMRGKALSRSVQLNEASSFAPPEIMAITETELRDFYQSLPELEEYRRSLYRIRRRASHILTPAEEKLLAAAGEMANAPDNIAGIFRSADLQFPDATDSRGDKHQLTGSTLVPLMESPDRTLRRSAFENYYGVLEEFKNTFAAALDAQLRQLKFFASARRYPDTLTASLDRSEVPPEVYEKLICAVEANLGDMHRYIALRKRTLELEELHMYDIYTPIVADSAQAISYAEAKSKVLSALSVLGEDYTALLREGFEKRWIDVYENKGKRSGAYSSGSSRPHPYVLLNHKDTLDGMFTIAHEMGHALHSYYSCKNQSVSNSDYVIFVAEVASTCNEVLLMRYLLENSADRRKRAYLINHFLDQFRTTLFRQTMFASFERDMGEMSERGETLTAQALCRRYLELNKIYYGPDMVLDEGIALEWARIPHFFYDYYVFQYATGFAAAVAIANRIREKGVSAVADYKRFLSAGSSTDPISLLKIAGVDMGSSEPVESALRLFGELVGEMEEILN